MRLVTVSAPPSRGRILALERPRGTAEAVPLVMIACRDDTEEVGRGTVRSDALVLNWGVVSTGGVPFHRAADASSSNPGKQRNTTGGTLRSRGVVFRLHIYIRVKTGIRSSQNTAFDAERPDEVMNTSPAGMNQPKRMTATTGPH